jgi:hypothetical protein
VPRCRTASLLVGLLTAAALVACSAGGASPDAPPQRTAAASPAAPAAARCPTTAAQRYGWGTPTRSSDFDDGLPGDGHPYGPEVGHDKKGVRSPDAVTVEDGIV